MLEHQRQYLNNILVCRRFFCQPLNDLACYLSQVRSSRSWVKVLCSRMINVFLAMAAVDWLINANKSENSHFRDRFTRCILCMQHFSTSHSWLSNNIVSYITVVFTAFTVITNKRVCTKQMCKWSIRNKQSITFTPPYSWIWNKYSSRVSAQMVKYTTIGPTACNR